LKEGKGGSPRGELTPEQASRPEQQPRPYHHRLKLDRFGQGRDLAPYTPEEEEEIRRGMSEWEIQSRRIRDHSPTSDVEAKQASQKRSYQKHRDKKLAYQRNYNRQRYKLYKAEMLAPDKVPYQTHKSYRQIRAEVQEQQNGDRQSIRDHGEADLPQGEQERPDVVQIVPSFPKK
jgi:hypothetical protein